MKTLENLARDYHPVFESQYSKAQKKEEDKDYQSGARLVHTSQLPSGVLGMYDPSTHTMYISNNLSARDDNWVSKHESAHAMGIHSEAGADAFAGSQTGYFLRVLGKYNWN